MNRDTFTQKTKYYTANVDADGVMTFPEEFLLEQDWRVGDEITFKTDPLTESVVMRNSTKELRDRIQARLSVC